MAEADALPIQLWEPADDPTRFLDLMRLALGANPPARRTPEFWRWKHVENPFGTSLGLYSPSGSSSQVIGLRMLLRWAFDGGRIRAVRAVDTSTHPEHRRRGVFSALTRAALVRLVADDVHIVFNTPNPVSLAGYDRLGWRTMAPWPRYFRRLRPIASSRQGLDVPRGSRPDDVARTDGFAPHVIPWDRFVSAGGDRFAALVERSEAWRPPRAYRTPRTWRYLAWRYGRLAELHRAAAGEPYARYAVVPLERAGGLRAAAVLRSGPASVSLVELFLEEPDVELGRAALSRALACITADQVVAHFAQGTVEHAALMAAQFHRLPGQATTFAVRPLTARGPDPLVADHWDLSLGDLEVF